MSPRMRFVGGPADGDVVERDEVKSYVIRQHAPPVFDGDKPVAYYERTGRDEDGTWVMGWKKDGFDTKRDL